MATANEKIQKAIEIIRAQFPDLKGKKFRFVVSETNGNDVNVFDFSGLLYCTVNIRSLSIRNI